MTNSADAVTTAQRRLTDLHTERDALPEQTADARVDLAHAELHAAWARAERIHGQLPDLRAAQQAAATDPPPRPPRGASAVARADHDAARARHAAQVVDTRAAVRAAEHDLRAALVAVVEPIRAIA